MYLETTVEDAVREAASKKKAAVLHRLEKNYNMAGLASWAKYRTKINEDYVVDFTEVNAENISAAVKYIINHVIGPVAKKKKISEKKLGLVRYTQIKEVSTWMLTSVVLDVPTKKMP